MDGQEGDQDRAQFDYARDERAHGARVSCVALRHHIQHVLGRYNIRTPEMRRKNDKMLVRRGGHDRRLYGNLLNGLRVGR